jgi:hypothetical protein
LRYQCNKIFYISFYMKLSKAYKEFGIDTRKGSINFNLLQEPKYSKNDIAKYNTLEIGNLQADLQFWNDNAGYKYLLVVVDIVSKNIDFEAIKNKEPNSIISGLSITNTQLFIPDQLQLMTAASSKVNSLNGVLIMKLV